MIQFNEVGYLTPYDVQEVTLQEFEKYFVINEHRQILFNDFLKFTEELRGLGIDTFHQWIDGNFVTKKYLPTILMWYLLLKQKRSKKMRRNYYFCLKCFKI